MRWGAGEIRGALGKLIIYFNRCGSRGRWDMDPRGRTGGGGVGVVAGERGVGRCGNERLFVFGSLFIIIINSQIIDQLLSYSPTAALYGPAEAGQSLCCSRLRG